MADSCRIAQNRRQGAIDGFRGDRYDILVATDVASRGIDVAGIAHVINYDVPATRPMPSGR